MNFRFQKLFLLFFFCGILYCSNIFAQQQQFYQLAGKWQCDFGQINLPGTIDEARLAARTKDSTQTGQLTRLHPYSGKVFYSRKFSISKKEAKNEWRLFLERTKPSTVWLDGDSIGTNTTILSEQVYYLGKLSAGEHSLKILIDNSEAAVPKGIHGSHAWTDATQTNWNGIIGKIGLESHKGILIEEIQVYTNPGDEIAKAFLRIRSDKNTRAGLRINGSTWNTSRQIGLPDQTLPLQLIKGTKAYVIEFKTGKDQALWSEFDPAMYRVYFSLKAGNSRNIQVVDFAIRNFTTTGTQFSINGLKIFLRGKHDACVFPLTGYPPMDKDEWKKQMRISKTYGINHYRFHSWTPPKAAFEAADEEGIYMQAELPYWGQFNKDSIELNNFLMKEGRLLLKAFGNHPSFVMIAIGNELGGDAKAIRVYVDSLRMLDGRRLYAAGSNNNLGTAGQQPGDDFFVTCRVGGKVASADFSRHSRASFSFADAKDGGYLNARYPSSDFVYTEAVKNSTVPVISHENGQFQVYPDYNEIEKYTGVLYPYNLKIFKKRLEENNLGNQAFSFHRATGKFSAICYKADIESCLRTPGFGGFQLLDLQDYPGQGSAYVGLLDAFMESKGAIKPEIFNGFCSAIVPLAMFPKYCWLNDEMFSTELKLFNYSASAIQSEMRWKMYDTGNGNIFNQGIFNAAVVQGSLGFIGKISLSFNTIIKPTKLVLELKLDDHVNNYELWVYPNEKSIVTNDIFQTTSIDSALFALSNGQKVLLTPDSAAVAGISTGGMFTPDYWNYAMFKNISEYFKRDVSPGTMSILTNPAHPVFNNFPTDSFSNWQWWIISKNSRPFILDKTPVNYKPLVQVIDNIERNHKLGLLFEMEVGKGKLLINMCNLEKIIHTPEGFAYKNALLRYMISPAFKPGFQFKPESIRALFSGNIETKNIQAVENITSYQ